MIPGTRRANGTASVATFMAAALLSVLLGGCTPGSEATPPASSPTVSTADTAPGSTYGAANPNASTPDSARGAQGTAAANLATLAVRGRAPKTGYDRAQFGQAWADMDRNGCDTRNDILRRDATQVTIKPGTNGCRVEAAVLQDRYSATAVPFTRGDGRVEIDHAVPLSDAWQKGAQQWTVQRRTEFANDPLNLVATRTDLNQQKSGSDAASWLPPNLSARCDYVARQIAVKHTYGLWVTRAEGDAMQRALAGCPGQGLPTGGQAPPRATRTAMDTPPITRPQTSTGGGSTGSSDSYPNCAAARAAGAAPLHRGVAGYRSELDGDKDGIGCE